MDGKQISLGDESHFTLGVQIFIARSERVPTNDNAGEKFNNLFVKNFPSQEFSEDDLRKVF